LDAGADACKNPPPCYEVERPKSNLTLATKIQAEPNILPIINGSGTAPDYTQNTDPQGELGETGPARISPVHVMTIETPFVAKLAPEPVNAAAQPQTQ